MVSVIILSFNTRELTLKCISSLKSSSYNDIEIIVVDNASSDGLVEVIKKKFPEVKLIENNKNVGFAKGNNQAMEIAKGEWILLINSDAFVFEDTISILMNEVNKNQQIDMLGCKILNKDGTLQPSYGFFPTLRRVAQMMLFIDNLPVIKRFIDSIHVRDESRYLKPRQVDWVTGAFVLFKSEIFKKIGGIDEKYFMYGEEMEWMYRIRKNGFKIFYLPTAECIHLLGASSKDRSVAVIGEMKGWVYWFNKHKDKLQLRLLAVLILVGCQLRIWLKKNNRNAYKEVFNEISETFFGLTN